MPDKIQGTSNVSQYDFPAAWDDSSTSLVTLGENSLSDVARLRNIDPDALLAANLQISDLKAPLLFGQQIQLPYCQAPVQHPEPAPDSKSSSSGTSGDPLAKSVVQANLKKAEELPPDEARIKQQMGEFGLRNYREMKTEFAQARDVYQKTGKMPPLKHFAPIEIMSGKWMSRSARYDANLARQGKDPSYPKMDVDVDPNYLTADEFREEWLARGSKEMQACEDEYIRPGKIEKCRLEVKEKYMGKEYMDASFAATAAAWNDGAYIEKIKNSGPLGLGGRVVGRGVGYLVDGKEGADKGEEIGGLVGDIGDVGVALKSGANARARMKAYDGSAGLEVRREAPMEVASAPRAADPVETQPGVSAVGKTQAKIPEEAFFLSHGTDDPSFKQMGGLGEGRIRVDHSPGERQDFGRGFYVSVGEGQGVENAEAFGDLRVRQRKENNTAPRQVMAWQVKRADLGDVVDVRPGGEHEAAWKKFLDEPVAPGVKMTNGEAVRGAAVEHRGEFFEKFLRSIGKQNADVVIGPIGTKETSGVAPHTGTQMVIRSQRVADRLNMMMGGPSGPGGPGGPGSPGGPGGKPDPKAPAGQPAKGQPSAWRQGSGTSVHDPKPVSNPPAEKPFSEGEEEVIRSYMAAGKTRAEAERLVKEARLPENQITWVRPNSPNSEGSTRVPDSKKPGPGKKKP